MVNKKRHHPPKWADWWLEFYCKPKYLEEVQGALHEYFYERLENEGLKRARTFYFLDVLAHFKPYLIKTNKFYNHSNNLSMFNNYFKTAIRNLWKYKLNSSLNIVGLTISITCFLMIMLWVNHEKTFDQHHTKADRIYRIPNTFSSESEQFTQAVSGPALGAQLDDLFPQIEDAARFFVTGSQLKIGDDSFFEDRIGIVDKSFFDLFDFKVIAGNKASFFTDLESLVITQSKAKTYFGQDNPIGKLILLDNQVTMKVTGVIQDPPSNSQLQFDLLGSTAFIKEYWQQENMNEDWGGGWYHTYLLLKENTDIPGLEEAINEYISSKLTWFTERNMQYEYFLQPFSDIHLKSDFRYDHANNGSETNVMIFTLVAIIVLLLACINYVNLTTASAIKRAKEMAIKKVIGARRYQLLIQHLSESIIVVISATVFATGLAYYFLPQFEFFIGHDIPLSINAKIIFSIIVGALLLGISAGIFPAMVISSFKPIKVIKGQFTKGKKGSLIRNGLVVVQFTMTIILIIAIITVNNQMKFIQQQELGMNTEEVLIINFRGIQEVRNNRKILTDRLLENSKIKEVAFQRNAYPVGGLSNSTIMVETGEGKKVSSSLYNMWVDHKYAATFGMEMLAGRFYSEKFPSDSTQAVVVNEAAVNSFKWGSPANAIGKEMGNPPYARTVICVVSDFYFEALHKKVEPVRILPVTNNNYNTIAIRAALSQPFELIDYLEKIWKEINPEVPLEYSFMNDDIKNQYKAEFSFRTIFMFFSAFSILIACLGLFGLATASTNQRIKEIGIRKIMGASISSLIRLISKEFIVLVFISLLIASPIGWYQMDLWLENFAYRINLSWTYIAMSGAIAIVIAMLTVSYQAFMTAKKNPSTTLRDI